MKHNEIIKHLNKASDCLQDTLELFKAKGEQENMNLIIEALNSVNDARTKSEKTAPKKDQK